MSWAQLVQQGFGRYGAIGSLQRAARVIRRRFRDLLQVHEFHFWYALALTQERPHIPMPAGFACRRGTAADLPHLQNVGAVGYLETQLRLAAGAELWLICEHAEVAGAFWTFHNRTPVRAARGGWLELPADCVCLEDSMIAARYRGLGLAPAGWSCVADTLTQAGVGVILTKIAEDNLASQRAVEKIGFRAIARMSFERVWLLPRVRLISKDACLLPAFLFQQLNR